MSSDFGIAVEITIVGMALVFLTLVICALVISMLSRIFKPKPEEAGEKERAAPILPLVSVPGAKDVDEAAAVAVAIALARRAALQSQRLGASLRTAPAMSRASQASMEEEIIGEVVTVLSVDPGPATWSGYGQIRAMR